VQVLRAVVLGLLGMLFLDPLLGVAVGAASGALGGAPEYWR